MNDTDDLLALLGVTLPEPKPKGTTVDCGEKPPRAKPIRFTEWVDTNTWVFGGYVAKVKRIQCACCESLTDVLEGIFTEEVKNPAGTRRLQQLAPNGDWPQGVVHRKEVEDIEVPFCGECIGDLGFSREVNAKGQPWTLKVTE